MPQLEQPSLVGETIGNYKIFRKLGEGGMGEVYAAEHIHIEKKVAVKLLRPEIVSNPEAVQRFRQEARSSSSIGHRNIISIEDFGSLPDGRIYMCMELLNGAALNDLITTPQPVDRLLNILIQTGHGLAAAHAKNIVHRDMKPENIFVTIGPNGEEVPKLLDFGIAKVAGNDGQNNLTRTGTIFGTPFYMAPEQALGNPVDARTDIYAMGVIMYEVFAGSLPFQGESFMGILTQHITTEPEPVAQRAAKAGRSLPPGLAEIITRCMHKNPAQRFATMDELVNELIPIYRSIAGAGMSTYMEAFRGGTSSRIAVPTPGAMGAMTGGVAPTVGPSGPNVTPTGLPMQPPPPGYPPTGPHGVPGVPVTGPMQHYDPNAGGSVPLPQKKSKTGLIIGIILGLAVLGGVGAFLAVTFLNDDSGSGKGSGSQVASSDPDAATGKDPDTVDAGKVATDPVDAAGEAPQDIDAAVAAVEIDAGADNVPPPIDAGAPKPNQIPVVISVRGITNFEVFENGTRVANGAEAIMMVPGEKRTFVIKAPGFKDKTVDVDGSKKKEVFRLDRLPPPKCTATSCPSGQACDLASGRCKVGCTATSCPSGQVCSSGRCKFAPPPGCTATSCPAGTVCGGDGKCRPDGRPPTVDCTNSIVNPRDRRCIKQFCRAHPDDVKCQIVD